MAHVNFKQPVQCLATIRLYGIPDAGQTVNILQNMTEAD